MEKLHGDDIAGHRPPREGQRALTSRGFLFQALPLFPDRSCRSDAALEPAGYFCLRNLLV